MSRTRPRLLVYAQDLGGARAILPVVRRLLADEELSVQVLAHGAAVALFRRSPVACVPLDACGCPLPLAAEEARALVRRVAPDLLFSATSHPREPSNGRLVASARDAGIPTVAILDHWKGLERFRETTGGPPVFAPALLGVMDGVARAGCLAEGLAPDSLRVVGHPYLEQIRLDRPTADDPGRSAARRHVVLFCSEIVHDHAFHEPCGAACLPLSEVPVGGARLLDLVRIAAETLAARGGASVEVILRAHPNEAGTRRADLRVAAPEEVSDSEAVAAADVVVGLSAMPLIEAAVLGKPAASLACFDGWRPRRAFITERVWDAMSFFPVLDHPGRIGPFLAASLEGAVVPPLDPARERELLVGATDRCVGLVRLGLGWRAAQAPSLFARLG